MSEFKWESLDSNSYSRICFLFVRLGLKAVENFRNLLTQEFAFLA